MSVEINFSLIYYVGDTVGIAATVTLDGAAYNLTGCSLRFTAEHADEVLWDRTIGDGISILSLSGGTALITPTLAQSQALAKGRNYTARAILTDAAGSIITTATGNLLAL
jgi:hypothetical protein